jgi:hypothetical protein
MGCDIHVYVEYRRPGQADWAGFGDRVNPGRDYAVFGCLAGVRRGQPAGLVPPRGIPDDLGWSCHGDWYLYITDNIGAYESENPEEPVYHLMRACLANPGDDTPLSALYDELQARFDGQDQDVRDARRLGACTLEKAKQWSAYGHKLIYRNGKPVGVEHPDWHTPSWLTPGEWEAALRRMSADYSAAPEYHALTAAMKELERLGHEVRVVFWFDN